MNKTNLVFYTEEQLPQGSQEWLAVRNLFGMASEVSAALGKSPWIPATPLQLYEVKTGLRKIEVNEAMLRGTRLEPAARAALELNMEIPFDQVVVTCEIDGIPVGASLDGWNEKESIIAEIKVPMKGEDSALWETMVKGGDLPSQYDYQTQQQLLVTGAERLVFWVYDHDTNAAVMQMIYPDLDKHAEIMSAWMSFWRYMDRGEMPPASEKDVVERDDADWMCTAKEWKDVHAQMDVLKVKEKELREELIELADNQSSSGGGVRLKRSEGKGRISYSKIPELKDVDLENFRGKPIVKYYITEIK
jgi:putative phage-type endonuclease